MRTPHAWALPPLSSTWNCSWNKQPTRKWRILPACGRQALCWGCGLAGVRVLLGVSPPRTRPTQPSSLEATVKASLRPTLGPGVLHQVSEPLRPLPFPGHPLQTRCATSPSQGSRPEHRKPFSPISPPLAAKPINGPAPGPCPWRLRKRSGCVGLFCAAPVPR